MLGRGWVVTEFVPVHVTRMYVSASKYPPQKVASRSLLQNYKRSGSHEFSSDGNPESKLVGIDRGQ